jgi:phospholipase D1/2
VIDRQIAFTGSITSKPGTCEIQVLRSAPLNLRRAEWRAFPKGTEGREHHPKNANLFFTPTTAQNDIHHAMARLIFASQHFVYIENQYFISDVESGASGAYGR